MLKRIAIRYGTQFLLVAAPMVTMNWSVLNLFGSFKNASPGSQISILGFQDEKQQIELGIRIGLSLVALAVAFAYEVFDVYLPNLSLQKFRKLYLDGLRDEWRSKVVGPEIRINVMFAVRRWYLLFQRRFVWTWNDGFEPPHAHFDANLWLTEYQGACGIALRKESAFFVDFREAGPPSRWSTRFPRLVPAAQRVLPLNQFRMWPGQIGKTGRLKAILSIPIFLRLEGDSPDWKCVGVLNLDTLNDEGAEFLKVNRGKLVDYFVQATANVARLKPH